MILSKSDRKFHQQICPNRGVQCADLECTDEIPILKMREHLVLHHSYSVLSLIFGSFVSFAYCAIDFRLNDEPVTTYWPPIIFNVRDRTPDEKSEIDLKHANKVHQNVGQQSHTNHASQNSNNVNLNIFYDQNNVQNILDYPNMYQTSQPNPSNENVNHNNQNNENVNQNIQEIEQVSQNTGDFQESIQITQGDNNFDSNNQSSQDDRQNTLENLNGSRNIQVDPIDTRVSRLNREPDDSTQQDQYSRDYTHHDQSDRYSQSASQNSFQSPNTREESNGFDQAEQESQSEIISSVNTIEASMEQLALTSDQNNISDQPDNLFVLQICREDESWIFWIYYIGDASESAKYNSVINFVECSSRGKFNKKRFDLPVVSIDVCQHDVVGTGPTLTLSDADVANDLRNVDGILRFCCTIDHKVKEQIL